MLRILNRYRILTANQSSVNNLLRAFESSVGISDGVTESNADKTESSADSGQRDTISKAMGAYLTRAKEHKEFMDKAEFEFTFGRRHLANMMGKDPENFTQNDINEAIRYLFPSGLYSPRARPMMKPPQEIYPKQKGAQFDMSGRPHHPFFYTKKPNFYYLLHEMVTKLNALNAICPSKETTIPDKDPTFGGSEWLPLEELENLLLEKINEKQYNEWLACMERIASHPKRDNELQFINIYRKPRAQQNILSELPPVILEPDGRKVVYIEESRRKTCVGEIKVTMPGTGQFKINGKGLDFFKFTQSKEQILFPMQLVGWLGRVDVEANTRGTMVSPKPGESSQAGSIRYGISLALAALGADVEKLRLAGLLTRDKRRRERKKIGQHGARAKHTWKKR